eukprot:2773612-Amphidinium_carterae.1
MWNGTTQLKVAQRVCRSCVERSRQHHTPKSVEKDKTKRKPEAERGPAAGAVSSHRTANRAGRRRGADRGTTTKTTAGASTVKLQARPKRSLSVQRRRIRRVAQLEEEPQQKAQEEQVQAVQTDRQ